MFADGRTGGRTVPCHNTFPFSKRVYKKYQTPNHYKFVRERTHNPDDVGSRCGSSIAFDGFLLTQATKANIPNRPRVFEGRETVS